jgi:two-component system, NtrC family, response regulator HydG
MAEATRGRVLIVDDQLTLAETLADGLGDRGYHARAVASSREAIDIVGREQVDVLVTDLRMPGVDGLGLLAASKKSDAMRPVIVMTAYGAVETAIDSIRQGAYHYLTKPFHADELALFVDKALAEAKLRREAVHLRRAVREQFGLANLIGSSAAMRDVAELVLRLADATVPVLVTGETGTGKGLVARSIHAEGSREGPFVAVNCAALPENLLESELFGHVKGAFTGATQRRIGLFAEADGGTLLLDEIGEMSPALQAKLLRVLETQMVRAVGADEERVVDVRVIAATHRDLRARAREGAFREDLLYRLDVVEIALPPLRQRLGDMPELVARALEQARSKHGRSRVESVSAEAMLRLREHGWPGNVRELEHVIERAVLLGAGPDIEVRDLPAPMQLRAAGSTLEFVGEVLPFREVQRRYAAWAYERLGERKVLTAEKLGVDFKTLSRWLADPATPDD